MLDSLVSGTLAGTGSFRCQRCGHVVTLAAPQETLPECPGCGAQSFERASLFGPTRFPRAEPHEPAEDTAWLGAARGEVTAPGVHIAWQDHGTIHVVALDKEWTRMGRSLAADVRFDDPTVSRRHALVVRGPDGVRVLDDRSLNGVFVNGQRVESRALADGDDLVVGRYHLHVLEVTEVDLTIRGGAPHVSAG
ncbi:MAG: FHA domain-containing protein [Solirubrobacteraceae bacterium MAG38_C4-C5]|nr:FHA domain-containing protein [Candidatus Siliceabacter maunaloa]